MTSKQDWKLGSFKFSEDNNSFLKQLVVTVVVTLLKKKKMFCPKREKTTDFSLRRQ